MVRLPSVMLGAVLFAPAFQEPTPPTAIDPAALEQLLERAKASESDALVLVLDGKTIGAWYFDRPVGPIEAMSATKSVVALAFGLLIAEKKLDSLDAPVARWFPEWNQGRKSKITIRHLLGNRSGLQNVPHTGVEIYPSADFVQLALCAELAEEPGSTFRYNNKAFNLLPGLVARIGGKPIDELLGNELFAPLGITDWNWTRDPAGTPHGMSGLQIQPADLARIGQLMLDDGMWAGKRLLPAGFVAEITRDQAHPATPEQAGTVAELWGQSYGLGWWVIDEKQWAITERLLAAWRASGAPEEFVTKQATLLGETGPDLPDRARALAGGKWDEITWQANRPDFDVVGTTPVGFSADGYLGQYVVVLPEQRLVAVRMRRAPDGEFDESKIDSMRDFKQLVRALVERGK